MVIQRLSMWSGKIHGMDLPITPSQLIDWMTGTVIQQAMPDLEPYQREFLISGMTPDEWVQMTGQSEVQAAHHDTVHELGDKEHTTQSVHRRHR